MGNIALRDLASQLHSRRIDRRRFLQGAAALGVSATAASSVLRATGVQAQGGTEVTFWTGFVDPELSIFQGMVDQYNGQASGHQVKLIQIPPAEVTDVTKLMTAVRGGTGPDVYHLDRFIVAQRAADGLLQNLGEFGADLSAHLPFARAEATFEGQPYAIPFDTDARAIYYNKGLLQQGGVDPAELDPSNGPLTWARVAEIANQFNQQDSAGNYTQMGFVPWGSQGWHYTYGFSWGGKFFDPEACQVTPDDPNIVAAFEWVQNYCVELGASQVQAFGATSVQNGFPPAQTPFILGTQAMEIIGDWRIDHIQKYAPEMDYGITFIAVPNAGDQPSTWAGGWSVVIPQGAKNPEPALEFMQWFAGEEGQRIYTKESKHLPTIEALLQEADLFEERHRFFSEQLLPIAKNRPPLPVGAKYWDELTVAWQKTYLDQEEPAQALATAKERVQADLQRFCPVQIEEGTA